LNHVAATHAVSAPLGMSASGQSGKHLLDLGIAKSDPERTIGGLLNCKRQRHGTFHRVLDCGR
jgi:hypothetical protein